MSATLNILSIIIRMNPATEGVGGKASLNLVPIPSPDRWGGLVAGKAFCHKNFARNNMASEDWPETSTPLKWEKM